MDRETFKGHLMLLADATNKDLSDGLARLWWTKYGGLEEALLLAAFGQALDTCRFFPAPAEFNAILDAVRRVTGAAPPRPEEEAGALLGKLARYNPDLGIVNDGTRGLLLAHGSQPGYPLAGRDTEASGFTARELAVLRRFGGAARCAAWDDKDIQFNRPRLVEAFAALAEDAQLAARLTEAGGRTVAELRDEAARRTVRALPAQGQ